VPADPAAHAGYAVPAGDGAPWQGNGSPHEPAAPDDGTAPLPRIGGPAAYPPPRRPRRLRLADVMTAARMRVWKLGALFTIAAGVAFTILLSWRAGVTAAVLAAIASAVYASRRPAALPRGARLSGAQRRTQRQLERLERVGFRTLHARPIPGSEERIDHLVVGPTGIYAIDSEDWDKRLPVRTKKARQLWHGPFSKKERLQEALWEARQASELLTAELGTEIPVRPAMAIYGPPIPWGVLTIRDVDVFSGGRLSKYLRKNARARRAPRLSRDEIEQIHEVADRVLPLTAPQGALR